MRRPASGARLPAAPEPYRYSIADLERETGITSRTIRYYITEGMLPPAYGRGPSATYDLGHLLRLQMIARLKREGMPLQDIKERLGGMEDQQIASLLRIQMRPAEDVHQESPQPRLIIPIERLEGLEIPPLDPGD